MGRESLSSLAPDDPRHGTVNGYDNLACRCDACRQAATNHKRERGHAGYGQVDLCACGNKKYRKYTRCVECRRREEQPNHGTESRYNGGCRCDRCRRAASSARRERRQRVHA